MKVRFSLATIVFETFELILCQMLSSQGKKAPSNPYPHYLVRLAASRLLQSQERIAASPPPDGEDGGLFSQSSSTSSTDSGDELRFSAPNKGPLDQCFHMERKKTDKEKSHKSGQKKEHKD